MSDDETKMLFSGLCEIREELRRDREARHKDHEAVHAKLDALMEKGCTVGRLHEKDIETLQRKINGNGYAIGATGATGQNGRNGTNGINGENATRLPATWSEAVRGMMVRAPYAFVGALAVWLAYCAYTKTRPVDVIPLGSGVITEHVTP